jgi:hypothetical protein
MSHGQTLSEGAVNKAVMSLKCGANRSVYFGTAIGSHSLVRRRALSSCMVSVTLGVAGTNAQSVLIVAG